jgi:ribosomal protein S18 acetylase RimI-like enzyme
MVYERRRKIKDIVIRQVCSADIEIICEIAVRAWQSIHEGYCKYIGNDDLSRRLSHNWQQEKMRQVREKAEKYPELVRVAEINGKIAGFTTFTMNRETGIGEIGNNAVAPDFQGMGIGSALHNKVLEIFRHNGMKYAIVSTGYEDEGHARARASYEKVGFKKMQTHISYSLELQ